MTANTLRLVRADSATSRPAGALGRTVPVARAVAGCSLAALALVPAYRLLARPETGLAGAATVELAGTYAALALGGLAAFAIVALIAARVVPMAALAQAWARLARTITAPTAARFGLVLALVAGAAAAAFNLLILARQANLVDAMSQLVHARYLATGTLAGPASPFWHIQQTLVTDAGWVSQYPPLHVLLLAAGFAAGAVWLVGPLLLAATVFLTALAADRLLPRERAIARVGVALAAVSPFLIAHAGAYMSHTTAAALAAAAVYCTARALAGSVGWSVAAGGALGALLATRPLFAVALGSVVAAALVLAKVENGSARVRLRVRRLAALAAGALPFALLLAAYNTHFFGHALRFGYEAALGPDGGLGFGVDPWGNTYGAREAIGYTSAELHALGVSLLESPIPVVALVGTWFALARRLEPGVWLFAGWAFAPVIANLLYWHHGLFMGPRMLNESAPAWFVLAALAGAWLVQRLPSSGTSTFGYVPRAGAAVALALAAAAGALVLGPLRLSTYAQQRPAALALASAVPGLPLVFVHGSWEGRVAMRLAAAGVPLDSVETALRQNSTCAVERFAAARAAGTALPALDFVRRAASTGGTDPLARLRTLELGRGSRARVLEGELPGAACVREAAADRFGALDITPLLWQADLPGLEADGPLYVRDLGPDRNATLIARMPERQPWLLGRDSNTSAPVLLAYASAMRTLWNAASVSDAAVADAMNEWSTR